MEEARSGKCHVFICYRQADGRRVAEWLYQNLHGKALQLERSGETLELDIYFDRAAPGIDDWHEYWEPKLQVSRALVFVCSEGSSKRRDGTDWVYSELDYWLANKKHAPIIVEASQHGGVHVPQAIRERWPRAQRIDCTPPTGSDDPAQQRVARRAIERILHGIQLSEEGIFFEELEHLRALNRNLQLATAQAEANEERATTAQVSLQVRNGMTAIADGNLWAAAVWFAEALAIDAGRGFPEAAHRIRLRAVTRRLPVLRRMWFLDGPLAELRFLPASGRLLVLQNDQLIVVDDRGARRPVPFASRVMHLQLPDHAADVVQARSAPRDRAPELGDELTIWDLAAPRELSRWSASGMRIYDVSGAGSTMLACSDNRLQIVSLTGAVSPWNDGWSAATGSWRCAVLASDHVIAACKDELWLRPTSDAAPLRLAETGGVQRLVRDPTGRRVGAAVGTKIWLWRVEAHGAAVFDVNSVIDAAKEIVDLEFNPDMEHVLVTVDRQDGRRSTLILDIHRTRDLKVACIDHEQAIERWEYTPPSPGGAASVAFAGAKALDPFEKAARFSADGRLVGLVSAVDHHVRVWDWRSALAVTPPLQILGTSARAFGFSPDSTAIALGRRDGIVALWDFAQPSGDGPVIAMTDRVDHLAFSPDGARLVSAGYSRRASVWDVERGTLATELDGHDGAISAIALSPDGLAIATGGSDKTVRVFDGHTGHSICPSLQHDHAIDELCFHDSRLLTVATSWNGPSQICVWEVPSARRVAALTLEAGIARAAWNVAGTWVSVLPRWPTTYGLSDEQRAALARPLLWNPESNRTVMLATPVAGDTEWLEFSDDDTHVWACAASHIYEFSAADGAFLREWRLDTALTRLLAVSRDGERLAMGRWERQVHVVDRRTGVPLTPQMDHQARGSVTDGAFSADGRRLITISHEQVRVWSADSGELLAPPFVHDVRVNDAVLDRSGEHLAISTYPRRDGWAGYPSQIHVWSLSPDARSTDMLRRSGQLASGRRVDSAGGLVPLSGGELRMILQELVACAPCEATERVRLWHLQQATRGDDFGRAFHARQIVRHLGLEIDDAGADAMQYRERATWRRRGAPAAEIADDVLADYAAAIERDPQNRDLRRERGEFYLEIGQLRQGLDDLALWLDVHVGTTDAQEPWTDLKSVYRLAFLALILDDTAIYCAACRRALTLARLLSAAPPVERWNGVFHACWTAILDGRSGLDSQDWSALHDLVTDAQAEGRTGDASLLKAAIAARGGDASAALLQLRDLEQRPFDHLFAALALTRLRRLEEASGLRLLAHHDIETWCERDRQHGERRVFGPGWPEWPAVAAAIEVDLDRALTAK